MAKVWCIVRHQGIQLILACSWARPAILVADKGRRGMFLLAHLSQSQRLRISYCDHSPSAQRLRISYCDHSPSVHPPSIVYPSTPLNNFSSETPLNNFSSETPAPVFFKFHQETSVNGGLKTVHIVTVR